MEPDEEAFLDSCPPKRGYFSGSMLVLGEWKCEAWEVTLGVDSQLSFKKPQAQANT